MTDAELEDLSRKSRKAFDGLKGHVEGGTKPNVNPIMPPTVQRDLVELRFVKIEKQLDELLRRTPLIDRTLMDQTGIILQDVRRIDNALTSVRGMNGAALYRPNPETLIADWRYIGPWALSIEADAGDGHSQIGIRKGGMRYGSSHYTGDMTITKIDPLEYDDDSKIAAGFVHVCLNAGGHTPFFFCSASNKALGNNPFIGVSAVVCIGTFTADISGTSIVTSVAQLQHGDIGPIGKYEGPFEAVADSDEDTIVIKTGPIIFANGDQATSWDAHEILTWTEGPIPWIAGDGYWQFLTLAVDAGSGVVAYTARSKSDGDASQAGCPPFCFGKKNADYGPSGGPYVFGWEQYQFGNMYVPRVHHVLAATYSIGYDIDDYDTDT